MMARLQWTISFTRRGGTPKVRASAFCVVFEQDFSQRHVFGLGAHGDAFGLMTIYDFDLEREIRRQLQ